MFNPYHILIFGWSMVALGVLFVWFDSRGTRPARSSRRH